MPEFLESRTRMQHIFVDVSSQQGQVFIGDYIPQMNDPIRFLSLDISDFVHGDSLSRDGSATVS